MKIFFYSCLKVDELNYLENGFKSNVDELCQILQSLPDNQRKAEMLKES